MKHSIAPSFTNGYDWRLNLDHNTHLLDGFLALSHTMNSSNQRATGSAGKLEYSKFAGEHWLWSLSSDFTSPKYNIDDAGFFFSPDDFGAVLSGTYKQDVPADLVRNYNIGSFLHLRDDFYGANLTRQIHLSGNLLLSNNWSMGSN